MGNEITRRDVMKGLGLAGMLVGMEGLYASAQGQSAPGAAAPRQMGECKLPPLPYASDALEPHIDKETLLLHHDKHHAAYVNGFNGAMKKLEEAREIGRAHV